MKLAQIRQFVALAEQGSFHRAAAVLNIAQPPLSVSFRKFEEELGTALLLRGPRGVKLTSAGELALVSARKALQAVEEIRAAVRQSEAGERGSLRIGFVASATLDLLPRLLIAYRARYPQIDLKLEESRTADLLADVELGRIDLAIVRTPVLAPAGVDIAILQQDSLRVAVPKGSKWSGRKDITLADLRDEPFVVFSHDRVPNMHAITMLLCQRAGFVPKIAEEAGQMQTILCLVASGIGVALVPGVAELQTGGFDLISTGMDDPEIAIGLGLVTRSGELGAAARNFQTIAHALGEAPNR